MRAWSSRGIERASVMASNHHERTCRLQDFAGLMALETPSMKVSKEHDRLYLDDLRIGQRFTSGTHVVDEEQIKAFARQFDPQPFHLDNEAARETLFAGLAASGWHTAALTMRLLVESGMPLAGGIIGAGCELDWPNPTRAGDILRVESEVLDVRSSQSRPDRGVVTVRSLTRNQRDEVVQRLTAKLIVPRRV
jgi:acyl dehydratase